MGACGPASMAKEEAPMLKDKVWPESLSPSFPSTAADETIVEEVLNLVSEKMPEEMPGDDTQESGDNAALEKLEDQLEIIVRGIDAGLREEEDCGHVEFLLEKKSEGIGEGEILILKDDAFLAVENISLEEGEKNGYSLLPQWPYESSGFADDFFIEKLEDATFLNTVEIEGIDVNLEKLLEENLEGGGSLECGWVEEDDADIEKEDEESDKFFVYGKSSGEHTGWRTVQNIEKLEERIEAGGDCENTGQGKGITSFWKESAPFDDNKRGEQFERPQMLNEKTGCNGDAIICNSEEKFGGKWFVGGGDCRNTELKNNETFEDSLFFNGEENGAQLTYPQRLDCSYYLRTGNCGYGSNCKFNHPPERSRYQVRSRDIPNPIQAAGEMIKEHPERGGQMECKAAGEMIKDHPERVGQMECKFYLLPGGCKHGNACNYGHHGGYRRKVETGPVELNFSGLPLRHGQRECLHYMRTGTCKFSTNCLFHHPDPAAVAKQDPVFRYENGELSQQCASGAEQLPEMTETLEKPSNEPVFFLNGKPCRFPKMLFPPEKLHLTPDPDNSQAPVNQLYSSEGNIQHPSAAALNNSNMKGDNHIHEMTQTENYPERSVQSDCPFFIKYGNCKFRPACKFCHPSNPKASTLNCLGTKASGTVQQLAQMEVYPERPGEPECPYFMKHGVCKFKHACKFHHPSALTLNGLTTYQQAQAGGYPDRPGEPECPYFMQHGTCKFTSTCKFHHPSSLTLSGLTKHRDSQQAKAGRYIERSGQLECPYFMKHGYCKFKSACRFHHPSLNLDGLTKCRDGQQALVGEYSERPTEPKCPYFMRHGDCKFKSACKFHHPALTLNDLTKYRDGQQEQVGEYPERRGEPECPYFMIHGYCKYKSACKFHHPSALTLNCATKNRDDQQARVGEYPEGSGERECPYFMIHGWCKFGYVCKFHHPSASTVNSHIEKEDPVYQRGQMVEHPEKDYPERPGKLECSLLLKYGNCKYRSACKYDHPKARLSGEPSCMISPIGLPLRPTAAYGN